MIALLLACLLSSPAQADDFWGFEDFANQDWAEAERYYRAERIREAGKLREKVAYIGSKNEGIMAQNEWSPDSMEDGATDISFTTGNGFVCDATTQSKLVSCKKGDKSYVVTYWGAIVKE